MPPKRKSADEKILFVLMRGLGRESGHWLGFPDKLKALVPGSQILSIDLPGTGVHLAMQAPLSIRELSDFVRSEVEYFLRSLKSPTPYKTVVIAPSFGGMIAADWIKHYPRDCAGAVFINTSFRNWSPMWRRLQPEALVHFFKILMHQKDSYERELEVLRMVSNQKDKFGENARAWAEINDKRPMTIGNLVRQLLAAMSYQAPTKPSVPVLLLNSLNDHMVHPSCSEEIAKHWNCDIKRHPTAGHDLPLDEPEWVASQISDWCEGHVFQASKAAPFEAANLKLV